MRCTPLYFQVAIDDDGGAIRGKLLGLEKKYAGVAKKPQPHPDLGCWWTLYDYGSESVKAWDRAYKHPYPGVWQGVVGPEPGSGKLMPCAHSLASFVPSPDAPLPWVVPLPNRRGTEAYAGRG